LCSEQPNVQKNHKDAVIGYKIQKMVPNTTWAASSNHPSTSIAILIHKYMQ